MSLPAPLAPAALLRQCDPASLGFRSTAELPEAETLVGQDRAIEALRFGLTMRRPGYNIFCVGPSSTGKHRLVREFLERQAIGEARPSDWCYVHNFAEPRRPDAIPFPPGRAVPFRAAMQKLVAELRAALPAAFEADDYQTRRNLVESEYKQRHERAFAELQKEAEARELALGRTPQGLAFAPMRNGKPLSAEAFGALPQVARERYAAEMSAMHERIETAAREWQVWQRELREKLRDLNAETARRAVALALEPVQREFGAIPEVGAYLGRVADDAIANVFDFLRASAEALPPGAGQPVQLLVQQTNELVGGDDPAPFKRYEVNVLVHNGAETRAPVVYEDLPSLGNLAGRIEHAARMGTLVADFTLIRPGALHRANGGYLVLDAAKLLAQPFAWDHLKRALRQSEIRLESSAERLGIATVAGLDPEPIPLAVKAVLVGDPQLYHLLSAYDPEFRELFKVQVEFDDRMPWTRESEAAYARFAGTIARREKLKPLEAGGVARLIEHAARLAGDRERLSTRFSIVRDIMVEADHATGEDGAAMIGARHIQAAIDGWKRRTGPVEERVREQILRGTVLIDTVGAAIGQVNGLSVLQIGPYAFGKPSRISARVRLGRGEVVDIERQVELGGPLHSKGVLILAGFLGARFAAKSPLALSATLVFEQSYGGVDGDSASSAELYALLSSLSGMPIKQGFAVTGSVNQFGQVQAIGGVNEKIEGFFDVCAARGLSGEQGVLIPASNVPHLMLRADIVAAVAAGRFRIVPIATVDQGIEWLTGVPAGLAQADGSWPAGTVNAAVAARLDEMAAAARRSLSGPGRSGEES